jgi:hypothetical protein
MNSKLKRNGLRATQAVGATVEQGLNFSIQTVALNFADACAANDLTSFFNLSQVSRPFTDDQSFWEHGISPERSDLTNRSDGD